MSLRILRSGKDFGKKAHETEPSSSELTSCYFPSPIRGLAILSFLGEKQFEPKKLPIFMFYTYSSTHLAASNGRYSSRGRRAK